MPVKRACRLCRCARLIPAEMPLTKEFFARSVHDVAKELIGATFLVDGVGGTIVELEAYHHEDPAARGYRGRAERNASTRGPRGHAYVSGSYGGRWRGHSGCSADGVL